MDVGELLLWEFDQEMASTHKILECVPEDKFAWKPHDKSSTLGRLANHLAAMPTLAAAVIQGMAKKMPDASSRVELLEALDKNIATGRAALAGASDDDLLTPSNSVARAHGLRKLSLA